MILCFFCVSILKTVFKKGHKTSALRLFGTILVVSALFAVVAYFINLSIEQTNKVSFKSAGVQYRRQFTIVEGTSLQDGPTEKKQTSKVDERKVLKKVFVNGTYYFMSVKNKQSTNSSLKRVVKQPVDTEKIEISSDLQVLSSFDCVKSIPTVLLDYISNTFLTEYGRSHTDFHSQHRVDKTLPLLKSFNINCGIGQKCSTLFQYDQQYGLNTTSNNTYLREDIFYCCPSAHNKMDQTISDVCMRAHEIVEKSVFRESKNSTFLEWVIYLVPYTV